MSSVVDSSVSAHVTRGDDRRGFVFISFKSEECDTARLLKVTLEDRGYRVWWQATIQCGQEWHGEIDRAIGEAGCIVVLWSTRAMNSPWVKHEASMAIARGLYTPARIELFEVQAPFNRLQATDLIGWGGDANHPGFLGLLGRIEKVLPAPTPWWMRFGRVLVQGRATLFASVIGVTALLMLLFLARSVDRVVSQLNRVAAWFSKSAFTRAVEIDNQRGDSPYFGLSQMYHEVAEDLNDGNIAILPDELRPNAWIRRATSEWRSKDYAAATKSAKRGYAEVGRLAAIDRTWGSAPDSIVLTMLPALILDSQLKERFLGDGKSISLARYKTNYFQQFKEVVSQLDDALEKCGPETPASVVDYWAYQTWRTLQNWKITIAGMPIGDNATGLRQAHRFLADSALGDRFPGTTDFSGVVNAVSNSITANQFYIAEMKRVTSGESKSIRE